MNQKTVWNSIAGSWSNYRNKPTKDVCDFAAQLKGKKRVLDIGCGNARNLLPFNKHKIYGIDFSEKMIKEAKKLLKKNKLKASLKIADAKKLPFKKNYFDVILCIAVFHHFSPKAQKKVLDEAKRVLKNNGLLFMSVWYKENLHGEKYIDWKSKKKTYKRYYYFFSQSELELLLQKNGFVIRGSAVSGISEKNIVIIATKEDVKEHLYK